MYLIESKLRFVVSVLAWADKAKRCKVGSKKQNNCEKLKFSSLSTFEEILSLEGFIFSHAMAVHLVANGNYLEGINQRWPTSQQTSG